MPPIKLEPSAPHCAHGQRVDKEGISGGGRPYRGLFCPNRVCPPEWLPASCQMGIASYVRPRRHRYRRGNRLSYRHRRSCVRLALGTPRTVLASLALDHRQQLRDFSSGWPKVTYPREPTTPAADPFDVGGRQSRAGSTRLARTASFAEQRCGVLAADLLHAISSRLATARRRDASKACRRTLCDAGGL
jgi:hypothetical protein